MFFIIVPVPTLALQCCRAQWHDTARLRAYSAVPGPVLRHGGTKWPGTVKSSCRVVPCPVPCRAAHLANYTQACG